MSSTNIGREIAATQYYVHKSYVPVYYYLYVSLEEWIASNIFRGDMSRIFMSSNDYVFRRRFELTDMSEDYNQIDASSLRFPFANYWPQNTGWTPDTRVASNTAALIYKGIYEGSTHIQAAASIMKIPVVFYFDREDDARLAYDTLYFYSYNKHYYSTEVPYGIYGTYEGGEVVKSSELLDLPFNIKIEELKFNPKFTEKDWLKQNRIYTVTCNLSISSYTIKPPTQPEGSTDVNSQGYVVDEFGNVKYDEYGQPIRYSDGSSYYYIVDDVILNLAKKGQSVKTYAGLDNFPLIGEEGTLYVDSTTIKEGTLENPSLYIPKYYRWDSLNNQYKEIDKNDKVLISILDITPDSIGINGSGSEGSVKLDYLRVTDVTDTAAKVTWKYEENYDSSNITKILYTINSSSTPAEIEPLETEILLKNLQSSNNYTIQLCFYTTDGKCKRFVVDFVTQVGISIKSTTIKENSIIGYEW